MHGLSFQSRRDMTSKLLRVVARRAIQEECGAWLTLGSHCVTLCACSSLEGPTLHGRMHCPRGPGVEQIPRMNQAAMQHVYL